MTSPPSAGGSLVIDVAGASAEGESQEPCQNLECYQTTCTGGDCRVPSCATGAITTLSGTVFDPAGKLPLYNALVYVPNGPVPAPISGPTCDRCDATTIDPVAATLTDASGKFVLEDVPVVAELPLVIQIGKWRRQVVIPAVSACVETALTDRNLTRLPRNKREGNIPQMAISLGGADSIQCLPRRLGLDDSEFTTESGDGCIHLYRGEEQGFTVTKEFAPTLNDGASLSPSFELWKDATSLGKYDVVILSCEGFPIPEDKPPSARQAMYDYASAGGRVFATHYHRLWLDSGPAPVPSVGRWRDRQDPQDPAVGEINTTFPKGAALSEWLLNVGASTKAGEFSISAGRDNLQTVDTSLATEWVTLPSNDECSGNCAFVNQLPEDIAACKADCVELPSAVQYMSFNAPLAVPESQQCGKVVFTGLHVSATGTEKTAGGQPFPIGCEDRDLSPQEKALAFMLFDLSSCIQNDTVAPRPPVVK